MKPIQIQINSLENNVNNWFDTLEKGIRGLEDKIIEAQNRIEALQIELHQTKSTQGNKPDISEEFVRNLVNSKKTLNSIG